MREALLDNFVIVHVTSLEKLRTHLVINSHEQPWCMLSLCPKHGYMSPDCIYLEAL